VSFAWSVSTRSGGYPRPAASRPLGRDGRHVVGAEFDIEHVTVLRDAFLANRLRNDDHSALGEPAQIILRHGLLIFRRERKQHLVLEDVVPAFGKLCPGFYLNPVRLQEVLGLDLLVERIGFEPYTSPKGWWIR